MACDWFEWKGARCTQYGITVLEQPTLTRASERATFTSVPGRSGTLTTLEGDDVYDDMILTATCIISDISRLSEICGWLKGGGEVTFANRPDGFYRARIVNQISFEKILRGNPHRSFAVNFRCQPFFYHANVLSAIYVASGAVIRNPGNVHSEPVLRVIMNGNAEITVGGSYFELTDINGTVTIDTPLMETYMDYTSYNAHMSGDYPILLPGSNFITWEGDVTRIEIFPNWRSL